MKETESIETWAIVEIMGHRQFAGKVSEQLVAEQVFLRIDVWTGSGSAPEYTKLFSPQAIYSITPVDEPAARAYAEQIAAEPFELWRLDDLRKSMDEVPL